MLQDPIYISFAVLFFQISILRAVLIDPAPTTYLTFNIMKKILLFFMVLAFPFCEAQTTTPTNSKIDLKSIAEIIKQKNHLYRKAYLAGDSASFANLHHSQIINMPPGRPLSVGKEAIGATAKDVPGEGVKDMIINTTAIYGGPDYVIEEGKVGIVTQNDTYQGKYIVVWKQESGIWKIYRTIWNMDSK
jgi:ketosteroid isomerase-like protein